MTYFEYFQAFLTFLVIVVPLALLVLYCFAFICEIPHWVRGWRLSQLAKKYNLSFIRARKGWCNGWLSLRAGERNIIEGSINGLQINYSDLTLVEGSLILGDKPSIAIQGSEWDFDRSTGRGFANRVTKINGVIYYFLGVRFISNLFGRIAGGQITQESQLTDTLKPKDFSKHVMKNYRTAGFYTGFVFMVLLLIATTTSPVYFAQSSTLMIAIFGTCLVVFLVLSWKLGKRFSPAEIDKYPNQDEIEARIQKLNTDPARKPVETKEFKFDWRHKTLFLISVGAALISGASILLFVGFLMSKVLNYDVVDSFLTGRQGFEYRILLDYPWIIVISFLITIIGLLKLNRKN